MTFVEILQKELKARRAREKRLGIRKPSRVQIPSLRAPVAEGPVPQY